MDETPFRKRRKRSFTVKFPFDLYHTLDMEAASVDRPLSEIVCKHVARSLGHDPGRYGIPAEPAAAR
jgi:hypothetical protein